MKKFLTVAALVVATTANAQTPLLTVVPATLSVTQVAQNIIDNYEPSPVTIQASGTGDTCKQALDAAKRSALEKANGSFLHSVEKYKDGSYHAKIEEYSGGVIKSYKYLRDDCTFVIIEAQVVRRSNIVQINGTDLNKDQIVHVKGIREERDRKQSAVRLLDDRRDAIYFKTENIQMNVQDNSDWVDVAIKGEFAFKDKWKADWKDVRQMFGYFNLPSFTNEAEVLVTAYDEDGKVVFDRKIQRTWTAGGEWKMWYITNYGVNRTVEVRIHETDPLKVKFRVPLDQLEKVKTFKVEVV
jgi:hypothetical protein